MQCNWFTPSHIIDRVRATLGTIDVDPASHEIAQDLIQAETFYTEETNGLDKDWGGTVFCNPPYSAVLIKKFTAKFLAESENGNMSEGIILTNSGTDTIWNQNLTGFLQAYTLGRISFIQPDGKEKGKGGRGQVFSYFGPNPGRFIEEFTKDNFCWVPNHEFICLG